MHACLETMHSAHRETQMQKSETNKVFIKYKNKRGKKGKLTTEGGDQVVPSPKGKRPTQTNLKSIVYEKNRIETKTKARAATE